MNIEVLPLQFLTWCHKRELHACITVREDGMAQAPSWLIWHC